MLIPPALTSKGRIGIVATARKILPAEIQPAIDWLGSEGYETVIGAHLYDSFNQFAGEDEVRVSALQAMLDDESINAILVARGGYGTIRLLDKLNLQKFTANPKWLIGYSDVTALHGHLNQVCGVATLHATMPVNIKSDSDDQALVSRQNMLNALRGEPLNYQLNAHPLDRKGSMSGSIVGGNLSVLYSLNGSSSMPDTKGKILFLEDLDEYLYHIDRMMMNLDRSGHLSRLTGLIVGHMTEMNDNTIPYGATAEEIIRERVDQYDFPVKFGFPAGHDALNQPIKLGADCRLEFTESGGVFTQD